jgi:hypothetical protein
LRRAVFTVVIALLALNASGAAEMLFPEPCAATQPGGCEENCPPTCVRCGCCAQPSLQVFVTDDAPARGLVIEPPPCEPGFAEDAESRDITHVPKSPAL